MLFKGSIPALVTPMGADGSVDLGAWDRLLDWHVAEGTGLLPRSALRLGWRRLGWRWLGWR